MVFIFPPRRVFSTFFPFHFTISCSFVFPVPQFSMLYRHRPWEAPLCTSEMQFLPFSVLESSVSFRECYIVSSAFLSIR